MHSRLNMNPLLERSFQEIQALQSKRSELNEHLTLKLVGWGAGAAAYAAVIATVFSGGLAAPMLAPGFMAARFGTKGAINAARQHQQQVKDLDHKIKEKTQALLHALSRLIDDGKVSRDDGVSAYYNLKHMDIDMEVELETLKKKLCI